MIHKSGTKKISNINSVSQNEQSLINCKSLRMPAAWWEHRSTHLGADEQVGDTGRVLLQLRHPFFAHVLETGWVHHREADEEDVGHRVGQRPKAVVVLLEDDATELVNMCRQRKMRSKYELNYSHKLFKAFYKWAPIESRLSLRGEDPTSSCSDVLSCATQRRLMSDAGMMHMSYDYVEMRWRWPS